MKELQRHRDAFELYFTLKQKNIPTDDAITGVASEYNRSKSTIYEWKKNFSWDDREAIRSHEINKGIQKETNNTVIENKVTYLSFYHKLLEDLKADFDIQIENVNDLIKVINGALVLQGEDTDRIEYNIGVDIHERIQKRADEYKRMVNESSNTRPMHKRE